MKVAQRNYSRMSAWNEGGHSAATVGVRSEERWSVEPKGLLIVTVSGLNFGWPWWRLSCDFVHILWQHFMAVLVRVSHCSTSHVGLAKSALGFYSGSAGFKCRPRHWFFWRFYWFFSPNLSREMLKWYVGQSAVVFSPKPFQVVTNYCPT
jgi:hypothetical protein